MSEGWKRENFFFLLLIDTNQTLRFALICVLIRNTYLSRACDRHESIVKSWYQELQDACNVVRCSPITYSFSHNRVSRVVGVGLSQSIVMSNPISFLFLFCFIPWIRMYVREE
jgi:hypothetical protein